MKIVAEPEKNDVEGTLCDTVRQAEILRDLMVGLTEHYDWKAVPEAIMHDVECAVFAAWQLRDMTEALKVEYYAEFERRAAERKSIAA